VGLDIFAASNLRYARPIPGRKALERLEEELSRKDKYLTDVYFLVYPNQACFRQRLAGTKPGLYTYTRSTRRHSFRAGSYSGYNWWRDQLSRFALGVDAPTVWGDPRGFRGRPFVELINFTDCDGRIGTRVATKLAEDFKSHAAGAKRFVPVASGEDADGWDETDQKSYWLEVYREFARAFRLAAKKGALAFC
jgi:hypothetical protein